MAERNVAVFTAVAAGKAVSMAATMLAPVLVGRHLGPEMLGRWTLLVAAGTLLHTALLNWTHASTIRYGREEWIASRSLNRTLGARLPLLAVGILAAAVVLMFEPGAWTQRWFGALPSDAWLIALAGISVWLAAEAQATLQASDRFVWQAAVAPIVAIVSIAALFAALSGGRGTLGLAVAAFAIPPIVGWFATWMFALAKSATRITALAPTDIWRHLRFAAPVMPTFALGYVSDWGDHVLLTRYASVAQVGQFGLAYQFMTATMAAGGVLVTMLLPRLIANELAQPGYMRTYAAREIPTLYSLWMIGTIWIVALLPFVVRQLSGPQFDESLRVLLALLIIVPASVVASLYTILFSVQERMAASLIYLLVMAATNLGISLVLIPSYGALGAAAGTVASYVVYQAAYVWDQHRALAVPAIKTWVLWITGLAIGIVQWWIGPSLIARVVWALAATLAAVAVIRLAGAIDRGVIDRLFTNRLQPIAAGINSLLVAPARGSHG